VNYRIIRHEEVEADLLEIADFVASYAGLTIGKAKVDEITNFIDGLSTFPKIGSLRNGLLPGLRAIPAAEKATVCFTVDDETRTVLIIGIGYAGSDWMSKIKDRG
jgi:plasmid stabilization system protein ParE